jgi:hypothetical protein
MELHYDIGRLLAVAVSRNDASDHVLQYASHFPPLHDQGDSFGLLQGQHFQVHGQL